MALALVVPCVPKQATEVGCRDGEEDYHHARRVAGKGRQPEDEVTHTVAAAVLNHD